MSLLVSDMGFLLDQNIVLELAAVSRHRWDFIGPRLLLERYAQLRVSCPKKNGTVLANFKRGWNCADKSRH